MVTIKIKKERKKEMKNRKSETLIKMFGKSWYTALAVYLHSKQFSNLSKAITLERKVNKVLPPQGSELLFKAFRTTPYNEVKVVIMGQDIYPQKGAYDGLAFSNSMSLHPQPSLRNILKEVERDMYDGFNVERTANLSLYNWAEQGVLLINAAHTVVERKPLSHMKYWMPFTVRVVKALNKKQDIIWLLWGNFAQNFHRFIDNPSHTLIKNGHPSPLNTTYPFVGCGCFSKCNQELEARNKKGIKW